MAQDRKTRSPWVVAIIIGFALMVVANAVFIYVAVSGADPIAASYRTERR
jgi:hypothetical protein